jgi:CRP/FNR family transcriptional regulator, cyclic AMP receptor protein
VQTSLFRKFVLFQELDDRELASIAAVAKTRRYAKDDVIFHADENGDVFCLIREGQVKVTMISPEGKEIILSMLGPGDFFGEMALLGDTVRNADVICSSPMTAMVMTDSAFRSLKRRMPEVADEIRAACRRRTEEIVN